MSDTNNKQSQKAKRDTLIVLGFALLLVITMLVLFFAASKKELPDVEGHRAEMPFQVPGFAMLDKAPCGDLNEQLSVSCVGTYSGAFVEDGTDEPVQDVLALVVKNISDDLMEYGLITMDCDGKTAAFEISALPSGSYVLVMEKNRMTYDASSKLSDLTCEQYALPNGLVMDFGNDFGVYPSDGVINIENISGRDFTGDVSLFYKNYEYGLFIGGITYRARFTEGIRAGEIVQSIQQHYALNTSAIMYMSYGQ